MRTQFWNPEKRREIIGTDGRASRTPMGAEQIHEAFRETQKRLIRLYVSKNLTVANLPFKQFIKELEKQIIESMLSLTGGNQKQAARLLSMKETTFSQKLKKHNIVK